MFLLFGAFIAGIITVLAPCVLPLLPIIIGGSIGDEKRNHIRPLIVAASLAISLILFTLLLKATTLLINVPPQAFVYASGGILVGLGLLGLFPVAYETVIAKLNLQSKTQVLMSQGFKRRQTWLGPVIIGAALGPVFSSCSPVYAYIIATILPVNFGQAFAYIVAYVLGLSLILLLIGYVGQRLVQKLRWASNPSGWFQRAIAIIFIVVGLLVISGYDKRLQTWVSTHTPINLDSAAAKLIPDSERQETDDKLFNVKPYPAPELTGLQDWINSDPQTLKKLQGKVVLIDFWTYSCINCIRANPYNEGWYQTYKDDGLVVLGLHAPEFAFEKVPANVQKAVKQAGLTYPVALDNRFATWNAYQNQYWPAHYLIDKDGQVRRVHAGEGAYAQTEDAIRALLREQGGTVTDKRYTTGQSSVPVTAGQTPETYLGAAKASGFVADKPLTTGTNQAFVGTRADSLSANQWTLDGNWDVTADDITSRGDSLLRFRVSAKETYVVGSATTPQTVSVSINGQPATESGKAGADVRNNQVTIDGARLYRLIKQPRFTKGTIVELRVPAGVSLSVFTFGS